MPAVSQFLSIIFDSWLMDPDAQITITKADFAFLDHPSYLSVGQPIRMTAMELNVLETAPQRRLGMLSDAMRLKIKEAATKQRHSYRR